jgi:glycosyltransferase involved in cell wall biosynthesis
MASEHSSVTISVVIPAYNAGSLLGETLDSVLAQSTPAHEIIVVDDGSSDDTAEVVARYGDAVRYLWQKNQGQAVARNTGIQAATGEWIALLDSDDLFLPERLRRAVETIEADPGLVLVYSAFDYLYEDGSRSFYPSFPAGDLWPALRYRSPILPSTTTIRRSALLEAGGFRKVFIEDWDLWFRLVRRHTAAAFQDLPECLLLYRRWDGNATNNHIRYANGMLDLIDHTLLADLSGPGRLIWKRKIEARIHHELAVELRKSDDPRHFTHAVESLRRWPLWGKVVPARRYKVFANMLYRQLVRRNG